MELATVMASSAAIAEVVAAQTQAKTAQLAVVMWVEGDIVNAGEDAASDRGDVGGDGDGADTKLDDGGSTGLNTAVGGGLNDGEEAGVCRSMASRLFGRPRGDGGTIFERCFGALDMILVLTMVAAPRDQWMPWLRGLC
ncbi:hypothetical protein V7S43_014442 [Phytophthora oleae]|uniref:Uncharacterized protein n=1 Tax=Phytophthora oleae TaxID=2107226 RepID=A0ABD3F1K4_9STRA